MNMSSSDTLKFDPVYLPDDGLDSGIRTDENAAQQAGLGSLTQSQDVVSGAVLKSANFKHLVTGWSIDGFGNVEFNGGLFRGTFIIGGALVTISDILLLQSAIDAVALLGGGTVSLVPDTYGATTSFTLPSNVTLDGNGSVIDFVGGAYQFLVQGSNAYSTGTVTATYASNTVTGAGTTWTAAMVGQSILIGDYWYTIATRTSNTSITLDEPYRGLNVSGSSYVIATTVDGASLRNITLQNSSATLVRFRYCNGFVMDGLTCALSGQGIDGDDSANVNWLNSAIQFCLVGLTYDNVPFGTYNNGIVSDISAGNGMALNGVTNSALGSISFQAITGKAITFQNCSNLGLLNYSIIKASSHGIEYISGNSDLDLGEGYINSCGGDGVKLTASSDRISMSQISLLNNGGYGINIADSTCDNAAIGLCSFSGNSSGALNDSGTGTTVGLCPGL